MAQYHFAAKIIQRSRGQSAVASAAYRAGKRMEDERLGKTFDFRRHLGVVYTDILAPANAPDWMHDRAQLWNAVEKAEKRKDSQLARSLDIALPHELSLDLNIELLRGFVQEQWVDKGMIADIAIHLPGRTGDIRNVHAHIALTTREITGDGFGRKERDWNAKDELLGWRKAWADHANRILEREGFEERIDHRSLVDQGIDREPTTHVGPAAKEMEQHGATSDRAQRNRDTKAANDNMADLQNELAESEKRLAELKKQLVAERMEQIQKTVSKADAVWKEAEGRWPPAPEPPVPAQPLQPQDAPYYPGSTPPSARPGGKADFMPDDLAKQQELAAQQEAERQKKAQDDERARQEQAAKDEADRLQKIRDDENKRVEQLAKQNADRLAAQAEEMRREYARLHSDIVRKAQFDAHNAEMYRRMEAQKQKEDIERQAKLEEKAKEGPIRNAGERYAQALGQNYDIRDPYASLAKSAMAEYGFFMRDRAAYDRQIAQTTDPRERQALDLRKRIEGADYLALTGDRISKMSEIITGRLNSEEAVKERDKATNWRIQAQDLRQQLRELERGPAQDKDRDRERTEPQPKERAYRPRTRRSGRDLDELIKKQDEAAKAKEQQRLKENEDERKRQLELERKRQRERERER
jgi:hypothetical protein